MAERNPIGSSMPEYLVCLECESPCYEFEWKMGQLVEIQCTVCGNEDTDSFALSEEVEAIEAHWEAHRR